MVATRIELRDFRNYERAASARARADRGRRAQRRGQDQPARGALLRLHRRSPRTSNERELVRRGAKLARGARHRRRRGPPDRGRLRAGRGQADAGRRQPCRQPVGERGPAARRASSCPSGSELVKGAPAGRRAHLDQVVAALWPAAARDARAYSRALAQRNALIARIRAGAPRPAALDAWDAELARQGIRLMEDRAEAVAGLRQPFAEPRRAARAAGPAELRYRPRSPAEDATGSPRSSASAAGGPRARLHRPRARTATSSAAPRGRRAAGLRVAGPAAGGAARAAVRRARAARRAPRSPR